MEPRVIGFEVSFVAPRDGFRAALDAGILGVELPEEVADPVCSAGGFMESYYHL